MEEQLSGQSGKIKTFVMVITMLLVIFVAFYIVFSRISFDNKTNNEEPKKEEITIEKLNVDDDIVKELMNNVFFNSYDDLTPYTPLIIDFYSSKKVVKVSDLQYNYLINNTISKIDLIQIGDTQSFMEEDFKKEFIKLYGDSYYDHIINVIKEGKTPICNKIEYDEKYRTFYIVGYSCENDTNEYIRRKIVEAEKVRNMINIYESSIIVSLNDKNSSIDLYKSNRTKIDEIKVVKADTDIFELMKSDELLKNEKQFNKYKYSFKLDNDNYYLESISLIK